ncbi:MAG TPA: NADH-quinone oxidoreductase subunit H [Candidatus Bathyarchaeota archaeon]|nr:NADH-quinone oxidoreductase subunit H [Candidatus Bathyarchaeota archaeon]
MGLDHATIKEKDKKMTTETFLMILQILVFPGAFFLFALAFLYEWIDRKVLARIQSRYGPLYTGPSGILQPLADFLKLLSKEDIVPMAADKILFTLAPVFYAVLPLTSLFIVPVASQKSLVMFEGDLIFVMFTSALMILTVFIAGYSSTSRFSLIGGVRAALQMIGFEIPISLAMIGPAIAAGSLSISNIVQWQQTSLQWTVWLQPIGFAVFVVCSLAEMEFVPFDIPEAETEIVAGWRTEFSGRKLALLRLGRDLELVLASALLTSLYLAGPQQVWLIPPVVTFMIKTAFVVLMFSLLRAIFARFRIDQMVSGMWKYLVPLAILQVILIQLGIGR